MKPKVDNEWLSEEDTKRNKKFRIIEGEEESDQTETHACVLVQAGLYGWRRQALAGLLLTLLAIVILNIALTLWMLKVMEFSTAGLGALEIHHRGVRLKGRAVVMDKLVASKITSRARQNIQIESDSGITLVSRSAPDATGNGRYPNNSLSLSNDQLEIHAGGVHIEDPLGKILFSANNKEVLVGADQLKVTGEGGAVFHGSVQTPLVRASAGNELRLESPTRQLNVFALNGVGIESRAGDISASALKDVSFQSKAGAVKLEAQNVYLQKLPVAQLKGSKLPAEGVRVEETEDGIVSRVALRPPPEVFQVCLCGGKGRMFLAPAGGPCITNVDSDICR